MNPAIRGVGFLRILLWLLWLARISGLCLASGFMSNTDPHVTLETTSGTIVLRLFPDVAPKACENFATHARQGYYDGIIFHRVIPDFMVQCGDPTGTGRGGQSIWGKPFEDEVKAEVRFDRKGLLAMANAGPRTNGSQFFITTAVTGWLHMRHTIFGEVVSGYDIVEKISKVARDGADKPRTEEKIVKATVTEGAPQA